MTFSKHSGWLLAALLPLPALAADAVIYGRMHLSADYLDARSADEGATISSNSSRLGFRGDHALSGDLSAIWQVEIEVSADEGSALSADRNTFGGLRGHWGELRAGRFDTPFKLLHNRTSLFADQVGDGRNILRADVAYNDPASADPNWWNERLRNSLAWTSPTWQHLTLKAHYSSNQSTSTATASEQASWSGSLEWEQDGLWLALAHEDSAKVVATAPGLSKRRASRAAMAWQLGDTRVTGLYQLADSPRVAAWGAGASQRLTPSLTLKAHYYALDARGADEDAELMALGFDYTVAKPLMLYLNYARLWNGDLINRDPWSQGRSDSDLDTLNGESPQAVSAGMIYRF